MKFSIFYQVKVKKAYTLLEIMASVAIMMVLYGLGVLGYSYVQELAMRNQTVVRLSALKTALSTYHSDYGEYPTTGKSEQLSKTDHTGIIEVYKKLSGDYNANGKRDDKDQDGKLYDAYLENLLTYVDRNKQEEPSSSIMVEKRGKDFIIIDSFGNPFEYRNTEKYMDENGEIVYNGDKSYYSSKARNRNSYDLWSWGDDSDGDEKYRQNESKWIKNW